MNSRANVAGFLYPTFIKIPCPFYQKLLATQKIEPRRDRTGAVITPLVDYLPGWFHCYAEFKDKENKNSPSAYEWAYTEMRDNGNGGKEAVVVVTSAGWKEWMFNFEPVVCECVAYHVKLISERCDALQAERLSAELQRSEISRRTCAA